MGRDRIGLLGGSFNPIHNGHLHLAQELQKAHALDEVWFVIAHANPLKETTGGVSATERLHMLALALEEYKHFHFCEIELQRPAPSYTCDTVEELRAHHQNKEFFLLVGEDCLSSLEQWKNIEKILGKVTLLIGARHGSTDHHFSDPRVKKAVEEGMTESSYCNISSTQLREKLEKGDFSSLEVPGKVLDYIVENNLYYDS